VRCAGRHAPRRGRTASGPTCGGHGGAAPRAGWRGWPRPRLRGAQPRPGVETPRIVAESAAGIGLRLPVIRCVLIRAGSAPRAPRGGTLTVPQTPPQVAWSDCACTVAHASAAMFAWQHTRTDRWPRMVVWFASTPLQPHSHTLAATRAPHRTASAAGRPNRHWPHMRGSRGRRAPGGMRFDRLIARICRGCRVRRACRGACHIKVSHLLWKGDASLMAEQTMVRLRRTVIL
jgi:hypothetical protein